MTCYNYYEIEMLQLAYITKQDKNRFDYDGHFSWSRLRICCKRYQNIDKILMLNDQRTFKDSSNNSEAGIRSPTEQTTECYCSRQGQPKLNVMIPASLEEVDFIHFDQKNRRKEFTVKNLSEKYFDFSI